MRVRALVVTFVALFAAWTGVTATPALAADSTAVVVIDTGTSVRSVVIHFDAPITGVKALQLAGGNPDLLGFDGQGAAVCAIDGVGNNPTQSECLQGPNLEFWGYYRSVNGGWRFSQQGAGSTSVSDGAVEGWRYGRVPPAPAASASFCAYVSCAPPPTDPPPATTVPTAAPPVVVAPGAVTDPGSATTLAPTTATNGKSKQVDGSSATGPGDATADGSSGTAKAFDGSTASGKAVSTRRSKSGDPQVALGSGGSGGGGGSGSPMGVLIVAGILLVVAAVFVAQRRRARSTPGP